MKFTKAFFLCCCLITLSSEALAFCIMSTTGCPQSGVGWPNSSASFHADGYRGSNRMFDTAFALAMRQWNGLSKFTYSSVDAATKPCVTNLYPEDRKNGWEFAPGLCGGAFGSFTLASTIIWAKSFSPLNTIVETDIIFNSSIVWDLHKGVGTNIDFRRVATHELGHALGLGHDNSAAPAIMDPTYSNTIETPQADDIKGLIRLYGKAAMGTNSDNSSTTAAILEFILDD